MKILKRINKEKLKELFKKNYIFVIGIALLLYKATLLNILIGLDFSIEMFLYTIVLSALIMSPTIGNKSKFGYIYTNIIYTIATIITYANFLYYSYSTNFLSLYQLENLKYAKEIGGGLIGIVNIKNIIMFWIDNVILVILSFFAYRKYKGEQSYSKEAKKSIIFKILVVNIILVIVRINYVYVKMGYNKSLIVQTASIYYYHYEDLVECVANNIFKEKVDEKKLKNAYNENIEYKSKNTEYTGIAKDCNVIILQLESLNEYIIGKKVNGKEITPNLNKFFNENIYCEDMYNQGLGTTADSEFEMENSMYPLENGYVFQKYYNNKWLDIYSTLKNEGYYTSFMHPNTSTFWNRDEMYNTGYKIDEYNDINEFPNIEKAGEFYSDEDFYKEAVNIMNTYNGKFITTLVSVTTHIPFFLDGVSNLDEKLTITDEDIKNYDLWIYRNYLKSCNFADYAVGVFLEELEKAGLMDNSIIIIYGDHGAGITETEDIKKLFEENNLEYTDFVDETKEIHIPFGIKIPGVDKGYKIEKTTAKIDVKPTIMDLLGLKNNFSIGDSIFSDKDYSFIKGLGYITSKFYCINDKYYDRQTLTELEENEDMKNLYNKMQNELYLSDMIIKNNLFN